MKKIFIVALLICLLLFAAGCGSDPVVRATVNEVYSALAEGDLSGAIEYCRMAEKYGCTDDAILSLPAQLDKLQQAQIALQKGDTDIAADLLAQCTDIQEENAKKIKQQLDQQLQEAQAAQAAQDVQEPAAVQQPGLAQEITQMLQYMENAIHDGRFYAAIDYAKTLLDTVSLTEDQRTRAEVLLTWANFEVNAGTTVSESSGAFLVRPEAAEAIARQAMGVPDTAQCTVTPNGEFYVVSFSSPYTYEGETYYDECACNVNIYDAYVWGQVG